MRRCIRIVIDDVSDVKAREGIGPGGRLDGTCGARVVGIARLAAELPYILWCDSDICRLSVVTQLVKASQVLTHSKRQESA